MRLYYIIYEKLNHFRKVFLSFAYFITDLNLFYRSNKNRRSAIIVRKIMLNYHSLEKGLSKAQFREGFGTKALTLLMNNMTKYFEEGFPKDDFHILVATSVMKKYIDSHTSANENTRKIEEFITKFNLDTHNDYGGTINFNRSESSFDSANFKDFALNRHSTRVFEDDIVDYSLIKEALEVAMKSPSACNRQGWRVRYISNRSIISELFMFQNGFRGYSDKLRNLIVITTDMNFYSYPKERYQGYIDSSLFLMSLVYALHYEGVGSCILNANFSIKDDKKVRKILDLPTNEKFVALLAFGYYQESNLVPKSERISVESIIRRYE